MQDKVVVGLTKRKAASRANGKRGGVKTVAGKAISSQNARKHGILSKTISKYDTINRDQLFNDLVEEFEVESPSEVLVVEQLVNTCISISRCVRFKDEMMREAIHTNVDFDIEKDFENILKEQWSGKENSEEDKALIGEQVFKRMDLVLNRYEPRLNREMLTLINTLKRFKQERKK